MKTCLLFLAAALVLAGLTLTSPHATAAPPPPSAITRVSGLDSAADGWKVGLSNGAVLVVELRVFETRGRAPTVGPITHFSDQGWLPILGYYGYATFQQGDRTYHGYRH